MVIDIETEDVKVMYLKGRVLKKYNMRTGCGRNVNQINMTLPETRRL